MSDLYKISPSYICGVIPIGTLIECDCKFHSHAETSQYGILNVFIVTKFTRVSRNIIFIYTRLTQNMYCVQYKH